MGTLRFFLLRVLNRVTRQNIIPIKKIRSKAERLAHVYEVAAWINESSDTEKILQGVADKIRRVFQFDATLVYLLDSHTEQLVLRASSQTDPDFNASAQTFPKGMGIIGAVAAQGEPLIFHDVRNDPRYEELSRTKLAAKSNLVFLAMFPIKSKSRCVGVFAFFNRQQRDLAAEDVDLIVSLSHQVGIAIENANLLQETVKACQDLQKSEGSLVTLRREMETLHETVLTVLGSTDLKAVLQDILEKCLTVGSFDLGVIHLLSDDGLELDPAEFRGYRDTENIRIHLMRDETSGQLLARVLTRKEARVEENVPACDGMRSFKREGVQSAVVFPLRAGERVLGIIQLGSRTSQKFTPLQIDLLIAIGSQVGIAVQRARLYGENKRRADEQEAINIISAAMSSSLDLQGLLDLALEKALEITGRDVGYIRLKDRVSGEVSRRAYRGISEEFAKMLQMTPMGKTDQVFQSGRSMVVTDPEGSQLKDSTLREGLRSIVWIPLKASGKVVGVLNVCTRLPIPFSPDEIRLLETIGNVIGNAIENARLFGEIRRNLERTQTLRDIDIAISSTLDLKGVMNVLLEKIEGFFPNSASAVRLFGEKSDDLEPVASRNIDEEKWRSLRYSGGVRSSLRERVPLIVEDVYSAPETRFPEFYREHGLCSFIRLPLVVRDKLVGALVLYLREKHQFRNDEVEFLSMLAQQAAIAIHNAQLFEQTTKQAIELAATNRRLSEQGEIQKLLKELSQDIISLDADGLFRKLTNKIREVFQADICDVRIMDDGIWTVLGVSGVSAERIESFSGSSPKARAKWIMENRKPLSISDVANGPAGPSGEVTRQFGIRGFLGIPIFYRGGEVVGVLRLLKYQPKEFQQEDIDLLQQIANGAGIALENLKLLERTRKQATELERANRLKSEFLSVMSHELRTPLTVVLGYAEMIQEGFFGQINAEQKGALQTVLKRSGDLLKMINSILEVTRIEADRVGLEAEKIRLSDFMEDLKSDYSRRSNGEVRLVWEYSPDSPEIKIDSPKVKQIVQNLIDNGLKFTARGRVTVATRCFSDEKRVEFQVKDTGIGIGAQDQKAIFNMFHQIDSSDTRTYGGAGVGLFVVKKFVELLGGDIHLDSELGRGSTFTVTLPYSPA